MANLRTNNLSGEQGQNAIKGSVVFGGGDNSSAGLTIADNSDLELSSETNWTIEFWLWLNGSVHGDYDVILGKGSATGNNYEYFVEVMSDNTLEFLTTSTGSAWTFQQQISPVLSADSWHHVAVVRNGSGSNSLKSYINGQEYGSFTAESIHTSAYPFGIGYFAGGNNLYSKITLSNLRIVKGTSVYREAFTPPFEELTAIPNTVLLCCQDSDNPFKEETGKTITGVGHLANGAVIHPRNNPPYGVDAGNTFGGPIQQSSQGYMYFPTGRTEERGRGRGLLMQGYSGGEYNSIVFINIQSTGNTIDFGDTTENVYSNVGGGNATRGIFAGGYSGNNSPDTDLNIIDYVTIATTGNAKDFGNLSNNLRYPADVSNSTRMCICGGGAPRINVIDFITIDTTGNAQDFGDLLAVRGSSCNSVMSPTRGIVCGGNDAPGAKTNSMEFITIASTGNAQDFGDLSTAAAGRGAGGNCSNNTRGVIHLGETDATRVNTLEFVTIATLGNTTDFGDLTQQKDASSPCSNSIRGVWFGGSTEPSGSTTNVIEFITIATTGNGQDFGDIVQVWGDANNTSAYGAATSDSHGGLS